MAGFEIILGKLLEGLAAGKPGFDVMPPFNVVAFVCLPTKQDDATLAHRRKIDQTVRIILQLDSEFFQLPCSGGQVDQKVRVLGSADRAAAAKLGSFRRLLCSRLKFHETTMGTLNLMNDRPNVRQQRVGFFNGKQFHTRFVFY